MLLQAMPGTRYLIFYAFDTLSQARMCIIYRSESCGRLVISDVAVRVKLLGKIAISLTYVMRSGHIANGKPHFLQVVLQRQTTQH